MKFPRDTQFDAAFDAIPNLVWYPFVGSTYCAREQRVFVLAHNIPVHPETYDEKIKRWGPKATWADCIEEYAYEQEKYTQAFRYFIKATVGLQANYGYDSDITTQTRVDSFIQRIGYINYIQDLVKSEFQSAIATPAQIEISKSINMGILAILKPTHCICWGKHVFNYLKQTKGFQIEHADNNIRKGFATTTLTTADGHKMQILKVYHPSMPGFSPYSTETRNIISSFLP